MAPPPDRLARYRARRDPHRTPEPFEVPEGDEGRAGGEAAGHRRGTRGGRERKGEERKDESRTGATGGSGWSGKEAPGDVGPGDVGPGRVRFVVQEHHATRLHWDLRIEHEGVLASWAIPNGIPFTPKENRLAVRTEDHPLAYLGFHGEIPKGQYGAGTMTIWDEGACVVHRFDEEKVEVSFAGERLTGRYGLFPLGGRADGEEPERDWMIHRMDPPADPDREPMPDHIAPMLADAGRTLPGTDRNQEEPERARRSGGADEDEDGGGSARTRRPSSADEDEDEDEDGGGSARTRRPGSADEDGEEDGGEPGEEVDPRWSYEVKWDGVRAIAHLRPGRIRLESRNLNDITETYPEIRGILEDLGMREAILDGEIVAFGEDGRPSFERLQRRMHVSSPSAIRRLRNETPVLYAVFDLLHLDGRSLLSLPYSERRRRLEELGLSGPAWRVPAAHAGARAGRELLAATAAQGLEGVVAKRRDSRYEPGRRTRAWVKVKHVLRQELVIGGWLPGEGRRSERIGALLMGVHPAGGRREELLYAGRVGTGFTERTLATLMGRLAPLRADASPFATTPRLPRNVVYVRPELVAEVEFREWTGEGVMRAPSFKGLRDDRDPATVVREVAPADAADPDANAADAAEADAADANTADADTNTADADTNTADADTNTADADTNTADADTDAAAPAHAGTSTPTTTDPGADPEALFDEVRRRPDGALAVTLDGRTLTLTNWDKVLYPRTGFTKGDLIAYYARIAPVVLPHLAGRALTLKRYPGGVERPFFYEKQSPAHRPEWVRTARVGDVDYTLCEERATLVWLANLADVELHTSLSLAAAPERPTQLVFDLDPGPPAGVVECCEVALVLRGLFAQFDLRSVVKVSGSKGMQVHVPLGSEVSYAETKPFARQVAEALAQRMPERVVSRMTKSLRPGRVLVDWSQNDVHKTTVSVYSVRARERPAVAAPVCWEEVSACHDAADPGLLSFTPDEVLLRAGRDPDPFAMLLSMVQSLP